ncbi:predicted protein [Uncinocarpus reesii 1704]|uniref:Uncharacterized protein n=1 Tax=Uncinocarpus reesii (strain UAMH 1704) TaxID=336963 RepID=C4JW76_UNCRE|nr:uncharacterized protein UREG_06818 [Uncinocarpus reesii 1704]EEP81953.1 predicted protein [Uncinocarpus reesii 1704]
MAPFFQSELDDARNEWFDKFPNFASGLNIYKVEAYKSGSKIEEEQFLALRTCWVRIHLRNFNPLDWGIRNVDHAYDYLKSQQAWKDYIRATGPLDFNLVLPVPSLGAFGFVWYYQQLVYKVDSDDMEASAKVDFSPIARRTRSKIKEHELREQQLQTPSKPSRGSPPPLPELKDIEMLSSSFDADQTPESAEIPDDPTDSNYTENVSASTLEDEQIVNTALISLASVVTFSHPKSKGHWSLRRKAFKFGADKETDKDKLYEARIDGHLFNAAEPSVSQGDCGGQKAEAQITSRYQNARNRTDGSLDIRGTRFSPTNWKPFKYLKDPSYSAPCPSLMTMFECGPWKVSDKNHMRNFSTILLAMTYQLAH